MSAAIGREGGFPLVAGCVTNALLWGESRTCCRGGSMGGQQKQQKNSKMQRTPSALDSGTHRTFLLAAKQTTCPDFIRNQHERQIAAASHRNATQWARSSCRRVTFLTFRHLMYS